MLVISYADRRTSIGGILLDVTASEAITLEGQVSDFLVEDGSTISDHITAGPERLRIQATVAIAGIAAFEAGEEGEAKLVDVVERCRRLHADRNVFEVSTGQLLYPDMGLERMEIARSADDRGGNWVSISAEMKRIRKVTLRTAEVPEEKRVSPKDGAKGRAGQTNKAAGKDAANGTAQNGGANPRGKSIAAAGADSARDPNSAIGKATQALREGLGLGL